MILIEKRIGEIPYNLLSDDIIKLDLSPFEYILVESDENGNLICDSSGKINMKEKNQTNISAF